MRDSRDDRNYGAGRRLEDYTTRTVLAERTVGETGRGSKSVEMIRSGLASLAEALRSQGIKYLEKATPTHMRAWALDLRSQLCDDVISRATTSSYISAVNQVCRVLCREDLIISAGHFGISRGRKWDNKDHSNVPADLDHFKSFLAEKGAHASDEMRIRLEGLRHSVALQEGLGLRFRESALIKLEEKKVFDGKLKLTRSDGTKNGRERKSTVANPEFVESARRFVLENACTYSRGSLVPSEMTWKQYRSWAYGIIDAYRAAYPEQMGYRYHRNRHYHAQELFRALYENRTGVRLEPPCRAGLSGAEWIRDAARKTGLSLEAVRALDKEIRLKVAADLGHNRVSITNSYLGR